MDNLKKYLIVLAIAVVSFSAGRYLGSKSVSTQSAEQTQTDQTKNINKDQNVVETTKETHMPDGTVVIEKRKQKETSTQTEVQKNSETSKSQSTAVENRSTYRLGVQYEPAIKGFQDVTYSGVIERRLFSEIYLGITASSRRTIGISLSVGI